MSHADLFASHADTIADVVAFVCRRHRLPADQAEEFTSRFHLKLVDDDCAVLRRFQGRSSMRTYLVAVGERLLLDWRISEWGKWRPCAEARRLGPLAVELDRLLTRDRLPFDAAIEVLQTRGVAATREELEAIAVRLAPRQSRRAVTVDALEEVAAPGGHADGAVVDAEMRAAGARAGKALARAIAALPAQDQVILRLRFQEGLMVARIATMIGEEAKPLYRRFERLLATLREAMEAGGVSGAEVAELFGHAAVELPAVFTSSPEAAQDEVRTGAAGPSTQVTTEGTHG